MINVKQLFFSYMFRNFGPLIDQFIRFPIKISPFEVVFLVILPNFQCCSVLLFESFRRQDTPPLLPTIFVWFDEDFGLIGAIQSKQVPTHRLSVAGLFFTTNFLVR